MGLLFAASINKGGQIRKESISVSAAKAYASRKLTPENKQFLISQGFKLKK